MNTQRLRQVRQLFANQDAPRSVVRHNMRAWVQSVRHLGDRWLLATPVEKKSGR